MVKKFILAIIVIVISVILGSYIFSSLFVEYGSEMSLLEEKTLVSPGVLVRYDALGQGLFTAYNNTGQSIVSKFSFEGTKQWEGIYASSRLLINNSLKEIIVVDLSSRKVNILTLEGEIENSWKPLGKPLYSSISNDKRNFVVSETDSSQTSWEISLELKDNDGEELFTKKFNNMEVVSTEWSPLGIAVLVFDFNLEQPGQYIYVFDNYGKELYKKRFESSLYDYDLSPSGDYLIYTTENEIGLYNLLLDSLNVLDFDNVVGVGFSSENRALLIQEATSILPPGKQAKLVQINLSGQEEGSLRYKGEYIGYYLGQDGTIAVATNKGIFLSNNLVAYKHYETSGTKRVVFDRDFIVYVLKDNNTIEWYK
ncbi:MAG: hypothetical protein ACLFPS_09295 [Clostridia bacterium]